MHHVIRSWLLPLVPAMALGCAATSSGPGRPVHPGSEAPQDVILTGRPYRLRHQGGLLDDTAGRGPGGRMRGRVCGSQVDLQVSHQGGTSLLEGRVAQLETEIWVGRAGPARLFSGSLGETDFALRLDQNGLRGQMGGGTVELHATAGALVGTSAGVGLALGGLAALWQMSAVQQGALVPLMLACAEAHAQHGQAFAEARFGGPAAEQPPGVTLALLDVAAADEL
ncbi:MAG: hypothetical protein RMK29_14795 [Myxococcales bacterium]|nr:hypothetical protein [Myxococcales bacterium]